jgi:hypothetical protein
MHYSAPALEAAAFTVLIIWLRASLAQQIIINRISLFLALSNAGKKNRTQRNPCMDNGEPLGIHQ